MKGIFLCLMILLYSTSSYAKDLSTKMKNKFIEAATKGSSFVAVGKMIPKELFDEYQKMMNLLKQARLKEKATYKRLKNLLDSAPEKEIDLINKLTAIDDNLKNIGHKLDFLGADNKINQEDIHNLKKLTLNIVKQVADIIDDLDNLWKELAKKKSKDEGWAFGITLYGSAEYATNKEDLMPIGGAALTANWHKKNMIMGLMLGAGVSVIDGVSLSWTFVPSLLFKALPRLSMGPALVISQDLGDMEGADRMVYEAGVKLKTNLFELDIWGIPSFGVHLERGYGGESPTSSFNSGITIGVDCMFL